MQCYSVCVGQNNFLTSMQAFIFFQMLTTLPTLIDFSVGGKTAVNNPHGNFFIGLFWSTSLINFLFLFTLPYTILFHTESLFSLILCSPRFSLPFSPPPQISLDAQKPCGQQHRNWSTHNPDIFPPHFWRFRPCGRQPLASRVDLWIWLIWSIWWGRTHAIAHQWEICSMPTFLHLPCNLVREDTRDSPSTRDM